MSALLPTVHIVEPALMGPRGHALALDGAVVRELADLGHKVRIIAHADFDAALVADWPCSIEAYFSQSPYENTVPYDPLARMTAFEQASHAFAAELAKLGLGPEDCFLVPTATPCVLMGLVLWLTALAPAERPRGTAAVMMGAGLIFDPETDTVKPDSPIMTLMVQHALVGLDEIAGYLSLVAVSADHASALSHLSNRDIPFWPLPLPMPEAAEDRPNKTLLLYAGDARDDKGFFLLPDILSALDAQIEGWTVTVHASIDPAHRGMIEVMEALRAFRSARNTCVVRHDYLDADAFAAMLAQQAVVLLPYDPVAYRTKTSGLLWQVLAAGARAVLPAGSWLARECAVWEAEPELYTRWSADAVAEAVLAAVGGPASGDGLGTAQHIQDVFRAGSLSDVMRLAVSHAPGGRLIPPRRAPMLAFGQVEHFGSTGTADRFCRGPWHETEARHRWSAPEGAALKFDCGPIEAGDSLTLQLRVSAARPGPVRVTVDRDPPLDTHMGDQPVSLEIPLGQAAEARSVKTVEIGFESLEASETGSGDCRQLGVAVFALRLVRQQAPSSSRG